MRILYIGNTSPSSTSCHRADTLTRLGHQLILADPYAALASQLRGRFINALHYRSGYRLLKPRVVSWLCELMAKHTAIRPDIVWVDSGELIGNQAGNLLRQFGCPLILYNLDDPTGSRDGCRFDSLLKALPAYDLCVVCRQENVSEFLHHGAKRVYRVYRSYDEIMHRPFEDPSQIPLQYESDIAFVGTWMRGEGRDKFLLSLIDQGLNIAIWGNRWQKSPFWQLLKRYWRGNALSGRDYVAAIQGSKISLGLVSHGNRDLYTTRSLEIPYAGGVLCAERTSEHIAMYKEGVEAVFWNDVDECALVCKKLLADNELRERIRLQGMQRVRQGGYGNEDICRDILAQLFQYQTKQSIHRLE